MRVDIPNKEEACDSNNNLIVDKSEGFLINSLKLTHGRLFSIRTGMHLTATELCNKCIHTATTLLGEEIGCDAISDGANNLKDGYITQLSQYWFRIF